MELNRMTAEAYQGGESAIGRLAGQSAVAQECSPHTVRRQQQPEKKVKPQLNRSEVFELLSHMEGELQAKEVAIAALKMEKAKQFLYQSKYGCFSASSPFHALLRDSTLVGDSDELHPAQPLYDEQLRLLDDLVQTGNNGQLRSRIQLAAIEKQYHKACADLEVLRRKQAATDAQSHDAELKLRSENDQLCQQLRDEKQRNATLTAQLDTLSGALATQREVCAVQRGAADVMVRDRKSCTVKIAKLVELVNELEGALRAERAKGARLAAEKTLLQDTASDRLARDIATERSRHAESLSLRDSRIRNLSDDVERLKSQLDIARRSGGDILTRANLNQMSVSVTLPLQIKPPSSMDTRDLGLNPATSGSAHIVAAELPFRADRSPTEGTKVPLTRPAIAPKMQPVKASGIPEPGKFGAAARVSKIPSLQLGGVGVGRTRTSEGSVGAAGVGGTGVGVRPASASTVVLSENGASPGRLNASNRELTLTVAPPANHSPITRSLDDRLNVVKSETDRSLGGGSTFMDFVGPEMNDLQEILVSLDAVTDLANGFHNGALSSMQGSPSAVSPTSPSSLHADMKTALLAGNHAQLLASLSSNHKLDLNQPMNNEEVPLHFAVEHGYEECVRVLLERGADPNLRRDDQTTPLCLAASDGLVGCMKVLLSHGAQVSVAGQSGLSALHLAAANGHADCCRVLLDHGARIDALTSTNWTALHLCINSGHSACLEALLTHQLQTSSSHRDQILSTLVHDVINMVDKDGWTVAHLAAVNESKDCLEVLSRHVRLDLERRDKWNRSMLDLASPACRHFLVNIDSRQEQQCIVTIELSTPPSSSADLRASPCRSTTSIEQSHVVVGAVLVLKDTRWAELEERLAALFLNHVSDISVGLRTKKTSRLDVDSPDAPNPFTLGISLNSIKYYSIGRYHWSPGMVTEKSPLETLFGFNASAINIRLFGLDNMSQDALAYDTLIPVSVLQNYLRLVGGMLFKARADKYEPIWANCSIESYSNDLRSLLEPPIMMEQYRCVVFYGAKGMGKTNLMKKLAQYIETKEKQQGVASEVTFHRLTEVFSRKDLLKLLVDKGCLVLSSTQTLPSTAPILLLDDLSKVSVVEVFKDILPAMETRGPANPITVKRDGSQESVSYLMHPNCYIFGTMDRTRSTGLELSIQQRFKWVQLRCDQEPIKYLLHRHLLRRLAHNFSGAVPLPDNSIYKAVEWVICVWQRLNDSLAKLGLLDMVFGPCFFLTCPVEANKPKSVLRWLNVQWNTVIAPAISAAVINSSGSDVGSGGQQKVASTALYVLMQRAVVSGCPLSGQEKERYFSGFQGSNELDIKIRGDKQRDARQHGLGVQSLPALDAASSRATGGGGEERATHSSLETVNERANFQNNTPLRPTSDPTLAENRTDAPSCDSGAISLKLVSIAPLKSVPVVENLKLGASPFAVSGVHSKSPTQELGPLSVVETRMTPTRASAEKTFDSPVSSALQSSVIVTQPIRSSSPLITQPVKSAITGDAVSISSVPSEASRARRGLLHDLSTPAELWRRAGSPTPMEQLLGSREYGAFVSRSPSPGIDMMMNRQRRTEMTHNAPQTYRDRILSGGAGFDQAGKRMDVRVVNPTKVLPLSGLLDGSHVNHK